MVCVCFSIYIFKKSKQEHNCSLNPLLCNTVGRHSEEKDVFVESVNVCLMLVDTFHFLLDKDMDEDPADYNGDDENEGEFEADKQAALAQI